ncbi:MAG TPA: HAMP domain-containing sensor histidine kinase [Mycobacteriales bacterium]|nr:HAMP domain-containing sensor histidine kinase [Mycobacteriales bacterium]
MSTSTEDRLATEYRRLVELNEAKERFLATVSHELRTPLTSILSSTELLAVVGALEDDQAELVHIIDRNVGRLLHMVDDLLLLARLESGQFPLELRIVDIAEVTTEALDAHRIADPRDDLALVADIEPGPPAAADPERLSQLLDHLLCNAENYTLAGGTVTVRARADDAHWTVSVADTGIGIPPGELSRVFEEFSRASNARLAGIPGAGLGLTISRRIAELHGGELVLDSVEGRGTTVTLHLPFAYARR